MMKAYDVVAVYLYPEREEGFEGRAMLIHEIKNTTPPEGFEYWLVRFVLSQQVKRRLIKIQ